jgi:hypothetical protein
MCITNLHGPFDPWPSGVSCLSTSLLSFLTFLIGLVLGHRLAIGRDKRKEFNTSAEKFSASFVQTRQSLRSQNQDVREIITAAVISDQEKALIAFERFLSEREQREILAAWSSYTSGPFTRSPGSLSKRPEDIAKAQAKLDALLKFAAPR